MIYISNSIYLISLVADLLYVKAVSSLKAKPFFGFKLPSSWGLFPKLKFS